MTRKELIENIRRMENFLCVGLDTDVKKLPGCVLREPDPVLTFNRAIIDATAPYCVAYKPNTAFYEARGPQGWVDLTETCRYIRSNYPDKFIIADAKRGDIGNTSALYARAFFEEMGVDAVTVAPYMGADSVKPFLAYTDKWVILLALTSNPGASDFEMKRLADGSAVYEQVLKTSADWADEEHLMYVVGATKAEMLENVRRLVPRSFLLVPGVGAQGGSLEAVCRYGMTEDCGLLVNSSRGIIYASSGTDYAEEAARQARSLAEQMRAFIR